MSHAPRLGLLERIEHTLYTAVISDSLDELGFRHQALRENLRPVFPAGVFAGWAFTMACIDVYHITEEPYAKEIEAVDSLLPGHVAVVGTAQSKRNAPWGELLSTASQARGARGAIIDGLVRDVKKIEEIGFPVYAAGIKPLDSKGRGIVNEFGVPVDCGGVIVHPGDLVVADFDGVMIVPARIVDETIALATDKATRETHTRDELRQGAYLRDVYAKYGVL
jgi:regulator of RNase E activity RraA